jgi:hypothetical protein
MITFVAAFRHNKRLMSGEMFHVEQCLAPTLKRNDIVVMDYFKAHKVAGIQEAIEKVQATVRYLPKYSPVIRLSYRCALQLRPVRSAAAGHAKGWPMIPVALPSRVSSLHRPGRAASRHAAQGHQLRVDRCGQCIDRYDGFPHCLFLHQRHPDGSAAARRICRGVPVHEPQEHRARRRQHPCRGWWRCRARTS